MKAARCSWSHPRPGANPWWLMWAMSRWGFAKPSIERFRGSRGANDEANHHRGSGCPTAALAGFLYPKFVVYLQVGILNFGEFLRWMEALDFVKLAGSSSCSEVDPRCISAAVDILGATAGSLSVRLLAGWFVGWLIGWLALGGIEVAVLPMFSVCNHL